MARDKVKEKKMTDKKRAIMRLRMLCEAEQKPKLLQNIESLYKDRLWNPHQPFSITDKDLHIIFDIVNDGIFGNRLGRGIPKTVLKAERLATGAHKYRGMQGALAGFTAGNAQGDPQELIVVRYDGMMNFFDILCAIIHEMIHMYDFEIGPLGRQISKYGAIAAYNFNYPVVDPRTGKMHMPRSDHDLQ